MVIGVKTVERVENCRRCVWRCRPSMWNLTILWDYSKESSFSGSLSKRILGFVYLFFFTLIPPPPPPRPPQLRLAFFCLVVSKKKARPFRPHLLTHRSAINIEPAAAAASSTTTSSTSSTTTSIFNDANSIANTNWLVKRRRKKMVKNIKRKETTPTPTPPSTNFGTRPTLFLDLSPPPPACLSCRRFLTFSYFLFSYFRVVFCVSRTQDSCARKHWCTM